jgi:F5/8 type C domain
MKHRAILVGANFVLIILLTVCVISGVSAQKNKAENKLHPSGYFHLSGSSGHAQVPSGDVNLALNKSATASSIEDTRFQPRNAVDDDLTTRWSSAGGHGTEWLQIDLGKHIHYPNRP